MLRLLTASFPFHSILPPRLSAIMRGCTTPLCALVNIITGRLVTKEKVAVAFSDDASRPYDMLNKNALPTLIIRLVHRITTCTQRR